MKNFISKGFMPKKTEIITFSYDAEKQKVFLKENGLVSEMNKVKVNTGPETLLCPFCDKFLTEIEAGEDLDKWVASVMNYPMDDIPPFSTDWRAIGRLLETLPQEEDYVGVCFFRHKTDWNIKNGEKIDLPKEQWEELWSLGFGNVLEGEVNGSSRDIKVAICRGVIWLKSHKRHKEMILLNLYQQVSRQDSNAHVSLNIVGELTPEKLDSFRNAWCEELKKVK